MVLGRSPILNWVGLRYVHDLAQRYNVADKVWWVTLTQGVSYLLGGRTFRRGIPVPLPAGETLEKVKANSRFSIAHQSGKPKAPASQRKLKPRRNRERTLSDDTEKIRANKEIVPPDLEPLSEDDGDVPDVLGEDEDHEPGDPPVVRATPSEMKAQVVATKVDKMNREQMESFAVEIKAVGPEGQPPATAKNRAQLAGWVKARQGQLAQELSQATE